MRPEVPQIGANGRRLPVEDLLDQAQLMKRLVPELLLRPGREDAVADAWYRRRDDERAHPIRGCASQGLGYAAADVVAGDHRRTQLQLLDQSDHAAHLSVGRVLLGRTGRVLVGFTKAAEIGIDHLGDVGQARNHLAVVEPITRPAVEQHHRVARPGTVVGESKAIHAGRSRHR